MDIKELEKVLAEVDGYCVGLTVLKDSQLTHYLYTNKFPVADILPSLARLRELATQKLENPDVKDSK